MPDFIHIQNEQIGLGQHSFIDLEIARLPTYTEINLPVHVYRAPEDGPVMLMTGGLHGDEINGIEIIRKMIANQQIVPKKGTVIAMPLVNIYGFIQSSRGMPDGKDINRSFPGVKTGSLARMLAYVLMHEVIPQIDFGIDFHTGGASRANYPQLRGVLTDNQNIEIAKAFSAPFTLHSRLIDKTFRKAASNKKKPILVFETGEASRFDPVGIQHGIDGALRVMHHFDMITKSPDVDYEPKLFMKSTWVRARKAGIFHSRVELGEAVKKSQVLGFISDPFGNEYFTVKSRRNAHVIGLNNAPVVHKGDALMHIGYEQKNWETL